MIGSSNRLCNAFWWSPSTAASIHSWAVTTHGGTARQPVRAEGQQHGMEAVARGENGRLNDRLGGQIADLTHVGQVRRRVILLARPGNALDHFQRPF